MCVGNEKKIQPSLRFSHQNKKKTRPLLPSLMSLPIKKKIYTFFLLEHIVVVIQTSFFFKTQLKKQSTKKSSWQSSFFKKKIKTFLFFCWHEFQRRVFFAPKRTSCTGSKFFRVAFFFIMSCVVVFWVT